MIIYIRQLIYFKGIKMSIGIGRTIGILLCKMAESVAPTASSICFIKYYQPKEPEGLKEFAKNKGEKIDYEE